MIRRYKVIQRHPCNPDTFTIVNDFYKYNVNEVYDMHLMKCLQNKYSSFQNMIGVSYGKY